MAKYLLPGVYYKCFAYSGGGTKESAVKIKCEETVYCDRRRDLSHCVRSRIPNQNDHRSTAGYESAICLSHYDGYGGKPGESGIRCDSTCRGIHGDDFEHQKCEFCLLR